MFSKPQRRAKRSFPNWSKGLATLLLLLGSPQMSSAQQEVYSRSENTSGLWWDDNSGNLPWYYATWGTSQNRPDNPINTANWVKIGHNSNTTMTVNGTFFWLGSLEIQSSATLSRTYNSSSGGGWSFRTDNQGFTNNSTGNQTINVEVGIDAATVLFRANAANNNTFTTNFYLNANTANFGGSSTNGRFTLNGLVSGAGGKIVKNGAGTLWLGTTNTFTGGVTLNEGTIRMGANSVVSSGTVTSGSFGTGALTINGGRIMPGGAGGLYLPTMLVNSNFSVNAGLFNSSDNGRVSFAGIMNLQGGTRTVTLGRWTNALGSLVGGQESWRFFSNNALAATITNGTLRFARDANGTATDYVSVNFASGTLFGTNVGLIIGSNVITTLVSDNPWGSATNPALTVEQGGYFNLSSDVNGRSARVQSLSGAGTVTSLANAASAQTSTLTVSNVATTDSSIFSGGIVQGNLLNASLGTSATNVTLALTKAGTGTLTLSGSNNYSGATTITAGALQLGSGGTTGSLGTSGAFVNNGTLIFNRSDTITQGTDFNSAGISGSGTIIKLGAGTVTLNAANTYTGTTDISNGAVRVANATGLGTSAAGTTVRSGAAVELDGGITMSSEAITLNGSGVSSGGALRSISGANTYAGTLTIASGSSIAADAGSLTLSTAIANSGFTLTFSGSGNISSAAISGAGALTKSGNGTLTLANSSYSGKTTISGGAISVSGETGVGAAPLTFVADQITLNGGTYHSTAGFSFNTNRGITVAAAGGSISVASGINISISNNNATQPGLITGPGVLTKSGSGTVNLGGANTFSGGFVLNEGGVRLLSAATAAGGALTSSAIGTGNFTINGGTLFGANDFVAPNITVNSDFAVNEGTSGLNGRVGLIGTINNAGKTNTVSLGRFQAAAGVLRTDGNGPSLRFFTNGGLAPIFTNGSMRFVRGNSGTASDFAGLNFTAPGGGTLFTEGTGFIIGTNVITTFNSGNTFTNASGQLPMVSLEAGGIFNLGTTNGVNSQTIRSLSGTAGYVTTLATLASTNTATLIISNQAGDNFDFGGRLLTGSELNATLGTTATNAAFAVTKTGQGTQVLSGNNTYGGATTISAGVLTFANTNAKSSGSQVTVQSNAVIGLGVGGAGGYDTETITSIISNSATGYTMNIGSIVGIDTTAGDFVYDVGIANTRELWKLGANTLTLTAGSGRTGATVVTAGTLELNASAGSAAGGTSSISVRSGATLLVSKSDQVSNTAAVTLSGGTISRGSGVSEVFGDLNITAGSFLDFGTGSTGTLQFQDYANTGSALVAVQNFLPGNKLQFSSSSFNLGSLANFNFGTADFSTGIQGDYFTITAIPEPSTILAAFGLAGLFGWPFVRRHLRRSPTNS